MSEPIHDTTANPSRHYGDEIPADTLINIARPGEEPAMVRADESVLGCIARLTRERDEATALAARHQKRLDEIRTTLRIECEDVGDNDWPDNLNLADVIEKHLARTLCRERDEAVKYRDEADRAYLETRRERDEARAQATAWSEMAKYEGDRDARIRLATIEECAGVCRREAELHRLTLEDRPKDEEGQARKHARIRTAEGLEMEIRALAGGGGGAGHEG